MKVNPMKSLIIIVLTTLIIACLTGPAPVQHTQGGGSASQQGTATQEQPKQGQGVGDSELAVRLNEFLENGLEKIDQGVISEGINQLVSVLAEANAAGSTSGDIRAIVGAAETELTKIAAGLEMEAGTEWVDANKNQISGSSIDVGTENSLNPSIILTYNFGSGKALVTGAPIYFEFVQGSGLLTNFVATSDYGQANCAIARLDNPNSENIVRASLVYRVKGFSYPFQGISKDFVYVPPSRKATILVMEKAGEMIQDDPVILDSVYNRLKDMAFDFSQYNGVLLGDAFMNVFGGDPNAIRRMGLEKEVSYLVMVLNDGYYVAQVELGGKKYNIFKSQTTATTRIIRVSDGKIMYSGTVQAVGGQGGSEDKAILDGFRNAAQAMAEKLDVDYTEIDRVLAGQQ
ncbi:MAG: hypothetical protein JSV89_05680 [Spirochaetaceae bacterium]|nr:MAG: hypothetical protein JSV89_05680 [Spirochaetaceae bacterium]